MAARVGLAGSGDVLGGLDVESPQAAREMAERKPDDVGIATV
jgi:hypothetical protein